MTVHRATPTPSPSADAAARLAAERDLVTARIAQMEGDMAGLVAASHGSNADDEHDPEGQTIAYERSQLAALTRLARAHLEEVDAALARLAAGTYGTCAVCHEPVGAGRLEARPTARTCVAHAGGAAAGRGRGGADADG